MTPDGLWVGVMSGTSLDGLDVVIAAFPEAGPRVVAARTHAFPDALRKALHALAIGDGDDLERLGDADTRLGCFIGEAVLADLASAGIAPPDVCAIGSHGQTVRHRPDAPAPFTLQIGDPAVIAECTGITVVADFRRRDVAAGGQGAPLVPAFHAGVFARSDRDRVVVNVGGMANLTILPAAGPVGGFDTGPGNVLLDGWARRHLLAAMDDGGRWAGQARPDPDLLAALLDDPWFTAPAPKSTGREQFDMHWLDARLTGTCPPATVAATLTALTARTIAHGIHVTAGVRPDEVLVCGGGRRNAVLMTALAENLPEARVTTTDACGVDGDWVEGLAFAWLARERLADRPGNVPAVTGAAGPRILGAIHAP